MTRINLNKATRIEGNASMEIHVQDGRVKTARFMVHEFRGFEKFVQGRQVEHVPQIISRICGLCSASHQVAGIQAVEDAVGFVPPRSLKNLREIVVLGEWIASQSMTDSRGAETSFLLPFLLQTAASPFYCRLWLCPGSSPAIFYS